MSNRALPQINGFPGETKRNPHCISFSTHTLVGHATEIFHKLKLWNSYNPKTPPVPRLNGYVNSKCPCVFKYWKCSKRPASFDVKFIYIIKVYSCLKFYISQGFVIAFKICCCNFSSTVATQTKVMLGRYSAKYSALKFSKVCLIPSLHSPQYIIFPLLYCFNCPKTRSECARSGVGWWKSVTLE